MFEDQPAACYGLDMEPTPVEIAAMGWVDVAQGVYFRWWVGKQKSERKARRLDFQVAECKVEGAVIAIFWSYPPAPPDQQTRAILVLREQFGAETLISLVEERGTGWSHQSALTPAGSEEARLHIARAVAVVQASWSWDESEEIRVEDAAGVVLACPRHTASGWVTRAKAQM